MHWKVGGLNGHLERLHFSPLLPPLSISEEGSTKRPFCLVPRAFTEQFFMDSVPLHDYVSPQQRSMGDSSNKRKAAYLGHMSDSYDGKLSESEGNNQEIAIRRDTDNHSINGTLPGENTQGHAAGRMSNHTSPLAQDGQQEPCGLSYESQGKMLLSYPGVKDIRVGSAASFPRYSHGMISSQMDCVPASTCHQAAIVGCIGSKSTHGIMDTQHVSGLVGNAASTINCGLLGNIYSNNSNDLSKGSELRSLNQQTSQNDLETENMKHVLPRKYHGPNSHDIEEWKDKTDLPCSSVDGIVNLHDNNAVPSSQEGLWDGFLQLSASVTVAMVAYFKSGEQNSKINWPERIEVKGRVRLEAFEKFIQDLPRSRHRALMVVSFCESVRSSTAGLVGMEEVAKSYEESKRIGFAEICPGIDLYICPRSETIITILAKYGFYKGMATARGNHLLIGCIVWRRNHIISNSRQKSFEKRKQCSPKKTKDSTSCLQGEDARAPLSSFTVYKSDPNLLISAPPAHHVNALVKKGSQGQLANPIGGYMVPLAATCEESESTCGNSPPEVSISLSSLASKTTGLSSTGPDSSYSLEIGREFVKNKNSNFQAIMQKPATESKEVPSAELKLPRKHSNQQASNFSDDDDLPEFDFSKTCSLARCTSSMPPRDSEGQIARVHPSDSPGVRKSDGSATAALFDIILTPPLVSQGSEFPRFPKPMVTDTHGTSMLHMIRKSDNEPSCSPVPEAKGPGEQLTGARSVGTTVTTSVPAPLSASYLRKLWDDDDDAMPEWRPPYMEVQKPVELQVAPASGPLVPLPKPQSTFVSIMPQPTIHKIPSGLTKPFQSSPPTCPPLPSRVHCHGHLSSAVTPATGALFAPQKRSAGMHSGPRNIGSNYTSNSASAKVFRPSSNFRFESMPPVDRRGWKH